MANQVATGAGNAFAYGTGAGGSLRMAYQEAMGADKAFAHGTGAGSLVLGRRGKAFSTSCTYRPRRAKRYTQHVQCSFNCLCASLSLSLFGAPPQKISKHAPKKN